MGWHLGRLICHLWFKCTCSFATTAAPGCPMAWSPAMQRDRKKLDFRARLTIENVVRRARNAIPPDGWRKFGAKPLRVFANFDHRCFKGTEVPCAKAWAAPFGVGDVFKVRIARQRAEEVAHMSNAWAWRPTSAAETRMAEPWASSSARRAAPCNHSCSISASDHAPRLQRWCSASSARYLTKSERASRRIVSMFMEKIVAPPPPGVGLGIHRPCGLCRLHEMVGGLTIACVRTNEITRSTSCRFMRHELDPQITTHGNGALLPRSQRWSVPAHGAGARLRSSSYPCAQQAQEGRGCP